MYNFRRLRQHDDHSVLYCLLHVCGNLDHLEVLQLLVQAIEDRLVHHADDLALSVTQLASELDCLLAVTRGLVRVEFLD